MCFDHVKIHFKAILSRNYETDRVKTGKVSLLKYFNKFITFNASKMIMQTIMQRCL